MCRAVVTGQGASSAPEHCEKLTTEDVTMLVLQCAFHDFDSQLAQRVGDFQYVGGDTPTITFRRADGKGWDSKAENRLRAPELKTASGAIAAGSTGDYEITEIKNGKGHFAVIADTRVWLHHHTEREINTEQVLRSMGRTLHLLSGLKLGQPALSGKGPPAGWKRWEQLWAELSNAGKVSVELLVTARRMRIPVARDYIFIGREDDVKTATGALVKMDAHDVAVPIRGARVCMPTRMPVLTRYDCCAPLSYRA